jgi:hypothetical protein
LMGKLEKAANRNPTLKEIADPALRRDAEDTQHFLRQYLADARKMRAFQAESEFLAKYAPNLKQATEGREAKLRYEDEVGRVLRRDAIPLADKLGWAKDEFKLGGADLRDPVGRAPWSAERAMADAAGAFERGMAQLAGQFAARSDPLADPRKAALAGLAGPVGLIDPAAVGRAREAFKLDDPLSPFDKGDPLDRKKLAVQLPTAAEYGRQAAAELYQRAVSVPSADIGTQMLQTQQSTLKVATETAEELKRQTALFARQGVARVVDLGLR